MLLLSCWLPPILIGALAFGAYGPILMRPSEEFFFLSYDDDANFERASNIQQLSVDNVRWALASSNSTILHVWEPVALVTKMCVASVLGFRAASYAKFGIMCHITNSALGFSVWRRILVAAIPSHRVNDAEALLVGSLFTLSVLFAVHPVNVEVVRWISANGYSLAGVMTLLSLAAHTEWLLGSGRPTWLLLILSTTSWLLHACAIFAKPAAVSVSIVPLAVGLIVCSPHASDRCTITRAVAGAVPFFAITGAAIPVILGASATARHSDEVAQVEADEQGGAGWGRKGFVDFEEEPDMGQKLLRASLAVWFYVAKVLCPFVLPSRYGPSHWRYYEPPGVNLGNPVYIASSAAIVLLVLGLCLRMLVLLVWTRTSRAGGFSAAITRCQANFWFWPLLAFCSFVGLLAPALGIFGQHINSLGSDRYCYLPFLYVLVPGVASFMYWILLRICRAADGAVRCRPKIAFTIVSSLLALYAICLPANRSACVKWNSSETLWRHAVEQDASKANVMNLATELMTKQTHSNRTARVDEAVLLYRQLVASRSADLTVILGLANALTMAGKADEALEVYEGATQILEGKSTAMQHQLYANYAQALASVERFEAAIGMYKAAIAAKPGAANERFGLGNVYRGTGQEELAIAEYEAVLNEIDSDHAPSWLNLGNLRKKKKGGKKEALVCFEKAVAADPTYAIAFSQLGHTLQQLRRVPEAIEALEKAVSIDPLHVNTWFKLAYTLNKEGRQEEAIEAYRQVLALEPTRHDARQNLGVVLHESEQFGDAVVEYRKVLAATPDDAGVLLNLGLALRSVGDEDSAKEELRRAVEIQPKYGSNFREGELD